MFFISIKLTKEKERKVVNKMKKHYILIAIFIISIVGLLCGVKVDAKNQISKINNTQKE